MTLSRLFSILGPGIVWAATSIGVSHIVQSTRAGADFGFTLIGFILLAHAIKYPSFLFGPKYAALTGKSLLDGYKAIGNWAFYLFLGLTFITMFFVQSGVTIVTSALAVNLFGPVLDVAQWSAVILAVVVVLLIVGRYKLLNSAMKMMMLVLVVASLIACIAAAVRVGVPEQALAIELDLTAPMTIAFIVALMGWMPTSIEVSVWHSLWTLSRTDKHGKEAARHAILDFNVGYMVTILLAVMFVWMGTLLMFGSGQSFPQAAAAFAGQLVNMYTEALGQWSWLLMAVVTFIALFSTTFAVADGFPLVWQRAYTLTSEEATHKRAVFIFSLVVLAVGSWWIIARFASDIKSLLDFVTTVSFVSAPVYAWLNYKVICSEDIAPEDRPRGVFRLYTLSSLVAMALFSVFFIIWRFF